MKPLELTTYDTPATLVSRLRRHGAAVAGPSPESVRQAIQEGGFSAVIAWSHNRKPETYRDAFARIFGESLDGR